MERTYISELNNHYNETVRIDGFVEKVRNLQYVGFVVVKDITGKVQITIEKENNEELVKVLNKINVNDTLTVVGKVLPNEKVKLNGMEIIPESITVTSVALEESVISESTLIENRLNYRFLDLRSEKNTLMFKVQTCMFNAMRDFLVSERFIEIHTPKLISAASESGSDVFEVNYFGDKAYLAQSPQFYKQMAIAAGFEKVFEIAPAFRAEKSNSYRHATEFTSFDIEFSYIDSYEDVMNFEEDLIIAGLSAVSKQYGEDIKRVFGIDIVVPTKPFPRISLDELYKIFKEKYNFEINPEDIGDMNSESEKLASKYVMEKYGSEFVFITGFSAKKRAFYHMRKNGIPQGYDLIWRGCEITTGAQREHRYEVLKEQATEKGLSKDVEFYLEFFKYGCPPHGGFALGVDRLTMLLLGIPSLKETMFLFRGPNRITP